MREVIVIGAGPAGNIAAYRLASLGHSVLVLDWRQDIGDKLCTGIIGTECADRFPPQEAHVYLRANTATVVSPRGNRYRVVRDEPQAYVIDRVAYVDEMARQAMAAGAEYELGVRVSNVEITDGGVSVVGCAGPLKSRYPARMVIVASGFGSPLLEMVGLGNGESNPFMIGAQAEVATEGLEDTEVYLGRDIAPGSFGWLVPASESRALIGVVSRQRLNGHLGRFISGLQAEGRIGEVIKEPKKWGLPLKPISRTYGDRTLVVGDAAGLAKPTTGGGIYYGLVSGQIAAETAHAALVDGKLSSRGLSTYEKRWKSVFGRELRIGYYARMLYEALGDRQVERMLKETMSSEAQDELMAPDGFSFDWHSRAIMKGIRLRGVGGVIRSFGPLVNPFLSRLAAAWSRPD